MVTELDLLVELSKLRKERQEIDKRLIEIDAELVRRVAAVQQESEKQKE